MLKIFKKINSFKHRNSKKGFTMVIAVTTMTLLLSIAFSISNIVIRQIKITNTNKTSKFAFFTADSAIECAFYYDTIEILGGEDENLNSDFETAVFGRGTDEFVASTVQCGEGEILNLQKEEQGPKVVTNFDVNYGDMCAKVTVERTETGTRITSRGYNTTADENGCDLSDASARRLVERGLTIKY